MRSVTEALIAAGTTERLRAYETQLAPMQDARPCRECGFILLVGTTAHNRADLCTRQPCRVVVSCRNAWCNPGVALPGTACEQCGRPFLCSAAHAWPTDTCPGCRRLVCWRCRPACSSNSTNRCGQCVEYLCGRCYFCKRRN